MSAERCSLIEPYMVPAGLKLYAMFVLRMTPVPFAGSALDIEVHYTLPEPYMQPDLLVLKPHMVCIPASMAEVDYGSLPYRRHAELRNVSNPMFE